MCETATLFLEGQLEQHVEMCVCVCVWEEAQYQITALETNLQVKSKTAYFIGSEMVILI